VGKLSRKLDKQDAEIAELRSKIIWTHAELPAAASSSTNNNHQCHDQPPQQGSTSSPAASVPQTPLPGILPIDVTSRPVTVTSHVTSLDFLFSIMRCVQKKHPLAFSFISP